MLGSDDFRGQGARLGGDHRIDLVEQLGNWHRRRQRCVGIFVPARERDDQLVGCGQHRIEQQLPVFARRVTRPHHRMQGEEIVAVPGWVAREALIVHPQ
jgi:hypothetical protein